MRKLFIAFVFAVCFVAGAFGQNLPQYGVIPGGITALFFSNEDGTMMVRMELNNMSYGGRTLLGVNVNSFFGSVFQTSGYDVVQMDRENFYFLPPSTGYMGGQTRIGGTAVVSKDWKQLKIVQMSGMTTVYNRAVSAQTYNNFVERLRKDPEARSLKREGQEYNRNSTKRMNSRDRLKDKTCSACGSTGVDPRRYPQRPSHHTWIVHYNMPGTKCPHCGYVSEHWHYRCASCNTPEY